MSSGLASTVLVNKIITGLRLRYPSLNGIHYEAAWTESWIHQRCFHGHATLTDAAKCGMPHGAGWYVLAVECGAPRELNPEEDKLVERVRFGEPSAARHSV